MQVVNRAISWWSGTFRKQGTLGKFVFGCISLFVFCCLCSIPVSIFSPSAPTPIPTSTELLANLIATQVVLEPQTRLPTNVPTSTNISEPIATETDTPIPTVTSAYTALGASCIPNNPHQTGKVVEVVDGDTIRVALDETGLIHSVRYIGMDTPENTSQVEFFGAEAEAKNLELVYGKTATLIKDVSETDQYGRLLRYVIVDNLFINYELVVQGYANTASYPPDIACIPTFQEAEQKASASKLGLWSPPPTLAPLPTQAPAQSGGGNAVCNCSGPDLDCKADFSTHAQAQTCYNYCVSQGFGDVFRLDGSDNDGLACESLP